MSDTCPTLLVDLGFADKRVVNPLIREGITTVEQADRLSDEELLTVRNFGREKLYYLRVELKNRGSEREPVMYGAVEAQALMRDALHSAKTLPRLMEKMEAGHLRLTKSEAEKLIDALRLLRAVAKAAAEGTEGCEGAFDGCGWEQNPPDYGECKSACEIAAALQAAREGGAL